MAATRQFHRPLALVSGLLLAGAVAGVGAGAIAGTMTTTLTGRIRIVAGATVPGLPNAHVTVIAVDRQGRIVASQETDDVFQLAVPSDRDYVLMVSRDGEGIGVLVWGDGERSEFAARGATIDLGYVGLNPETRRAFALRELDLRAPRHGGRVAGPTFVTEE